MPVQNNFKIFNVANDANLTMSDEEYDDTLYRLNGLIPQVADPKAHNKMYRQWSIMTTAVANMIYDKGYNALDSDITTLTNNLVSAVGDVAEAKVDSRISTLENWKDDITATTTEINYLTGAESNIQNQINSISGSLATPFPAWIKNTAYAVGDICICTGFNSYKYLECVVAGTTGATAPVNANVGQLVTDNEVKWLVCDFRDSAPVGSIRQDLVKRDGWLKLNGATVNVADYPRLVSFLSANSLIQSYTASPVATDFTYGDSNNETLILPDFTDLFIENGSSALVVKNAGLPNLAGTVGYARSNSMPTSSADNYLNSTNALTWTDDSPTKANGLSSSDIGTGYKTFGQINLNASRQNSIYGNSSTVQPPAVTLIPVIKY